MPTLHHDGAEIAYDVAGPEGAPPVVLLHGITGAASTWHDVVADLAADHRTYAVDQRGHGRSSRRRGTYDVAHWAGDVIALLEEVVGEPASLVGHSLGGVVSAAVLQRRPDLVRAAVLEDPPLFLGDPDEGLGTTPFATLFGLLLHHFRDMQARGATAEEYAAASATAPALNGKGTMADVVSPAVLLRNGEASRDFDPDCLEDALAGKGLATFDPLLPLGDGRVPVLVLRAEPDLTAAFRPQDEAPFLAANPNAVIELVPGASHLIHEEQPDAFVARVRAFLASHR